MFLINDKVNINMIIGFRGFGMNVRVIGSNLISVVKKKKKENINPIKMTAITDTTTLILKDFLP